LDRYTKDYGDTSLRATSAFSESDAEKDTVIASNPILSFRMLNRYANEFLAIGENINQNAEKGTTSNTQNNF
jgi:hypothetical protein